MRRYNYAANNPVKLIEPDGRAPQEWQDVTSDTVLGALVHIVLQTVVQVRLGVRGIPSLTELPTLPGGSKQHPNDPNYASKIDHTVLTPAFPMNVGFWVAQNYENKPDSKAGDLSDYQAYKYQSEVQLYSKYTPKEFPYGLDTVVEARPGSFIEEIDKEERATGIPEKDLPLAPVEVITPTVSMRINIRLEDSTSGRKVRGEVF